MNFFFPVFQPSSCRLRLIFLIIFIGSIFWEEAAFGGRVVFVPLWSFLLYILGRKGRWCNALRVKSSFALARPCFCGNLHLDLGVQCSKIFVIV